MWLTGAANTAIMKTQTETSRATSGAVFGTAANCQVAAMTQIRVIAASQTDRRPSVVRAAGIAAAGSLTS